MGVLKPIELESKIIKNKFFVIQVFICFTLILQLTELFTPLRFCTYQNYRRVSGTKQPLLKKKQFDYASIISLKYNMKVNFIEVDYIIAIKIVSKYFKLTNKTRKKSHKKKSKLYFLTNYKTNREKRKISFCQINVVFNL